MYSAVNSIFHFPYVDPDYPTSGLTVIGLLRIDCLNFAMPLWSSGQSFWLQIQRSRVLFPVLPDVLRSSGGSGTGSTQPREDNSGAT
jgi:hypothetical protein